MSRLGPAILPGGVARLRSADAGAPDLLAAGALVLAGIAVALAAMAPGGFTSALRPAGAATERVLGLSTLVAMLAGGTASASERRPVRVLGGLGVLLVFVGVQLSVEWPAQRPGGFALPFFLGGAVLVVLAGAPLFVLGALRPEGQGRTGRQQGDYDDSASGRR